MLSLRHPRVCSGCASKTGASRVLGNNGENTHTFGRDICRALALGAKRGVHMGIVGEPGSGKSMILQPLESIFRSMPPPEDGSTFPWAGALDAEIFLWQDFEYSAKTMNFMDMLRAFVGERIGVRLPGEKNRKFNNTCPLFYSGLQKIAPTSRGLTASSFTKKAKAMDERFTLRQWDQPLPMHLRIPNFPHCARCFSAFMLDNDAAWHLPSEHGVWL